MQHLIVDGIGTGKPLLGIHRTIPQSGPEAILEVEVGLIANLIPSDVEISELLSCGIGVCGNLAQIITLLVGQVQAECDRRAFGKAIEGRKELGSNDEFIRLECSIGCHGVRVHLH